jgi:hypothetical protein
MAAPKEMDVVRRAYELWQQAGEPSGKDDEFYHQAKKELQEALDKENQPSEIDKNFILVIVAAHISWFEHHPQDLSRMHFSGLRSVGFLPSAVWRSGFYFLRFKRQRKFAAETVSQRRCQRVAVCCRHGPALLSAARHAGMPITTSNLSAVATRWVRVPRSP